MDAWLDAEGATAPRAMCVLAGAGTGKSTISAAIWAQVSAQWRHMLDKDVWGEALDERCFNYSP